MSKSFRPISFEKLRVGKLIKSSKKRFCWKFDLDSSTHELLLYASRISGKRSVILDGNKKIATKTSGFGSTYPIKIEKHSIVIYELNDTNFELRVDNVAFRIVEGGFLQAPQESPYRNKSSEPRRLDEENFGFPSKELDAKVDVFKAKQRKLSPVPGASPEKIKIDWDKETSKKEPAANPPKPQINVMDLFDYPAPSNDLPADLFAPLTSESVSSFNPFEEKKEEKQPEIMIQPMKAENKRNDDLFSLVDLDGLHLGDNYSPAFAKKLEEANRPVTIQNSNVPNLPMQDLLAQRSPTSQGMQPMMMNPMAGMMQMNPFMTGMMMGQWNGYYPNPNNK